MENASKAMLMAASVLIGIMIVSVMIYIFSLFGDFSATQEREREEQQREAFNGRFLKYDGLENVTVHDIVTIINLAAQNNRDRGFVNAAGDIVTQEANDHEYYIQVEINNYVQDANTMGGNHSETWSEVAIQEFIENNTLETGTSNLKTFTCKVTTGTDTKYVKKVTLDGTP